MKNIFPLLLLMFFLSACPKPKATSDLFDGKWQMETYTAFMPEQPVIGEGEVVWTFHAANQSVEVQNNLSAQYPFLKPSGTYAYNEMADSKVTIDGQTFDFKFEGNKLTISDKPELDGPMIIFKKVD